MAKQFSYVVDFLCFFGSCMFNMFCSSILIFICCSAFAAFELFYRFVL